MSEAEMVVVSEESLAGVQAGPDPVLQRWVDYVAAEATRRLSQDTEEDAAVAGASYRHRAHGVIAAVLDQAAGAALAQGRAVLDRAREEEVARLALARVCGLGALEPLLADPHIENINLTGTQVWVRYADGRREQRPPIVADEEELVALVRRIAAEAPEGEKRFDPAAPILDMRLADGSRLHAV